MAIKIIRIALTSERGVLEHGALVRQLGGERVTAENRGEHARELGLPCGNR